MLKSFDNITKMALIRRGLFIFNKNIRSIPIATQSKYNLRKNKIISNNYKFQKQQIHRSSSKNSPMGGADFDGVEETGG